jgi:hypothetical protein
MTVSSRGESLPFSFRLLGAAAALLIAMTSWHPLLTREPGAVSADTLILIFAILLGGFGALTLLRTSRWPNAPVRTALAAATLLAGVIILSMPLPPRIETWGSLILMAVVAAVALLAETLLDTRPRAAAWLLLFLGAAGCYMAYAVSRYAMSPVMGDRVKESFGPVALVASACVVAVWHGRALWRINPRRAHEAAL